MSTELQKTDVIPESTPAKPLSKEDRIISELAVINDNSSEITAALTAINMNLAALLESQQRVEKLAAKQAKDVTSIKAATTFFLILAIISLLPLFGLVMRTCTGA